MEIKTVPIVQVKPWDDNPRNITNENFKKLKEQIQELGVYKPLLVFEENGDYVTLGGNMRLRALYELEHQQVDVSIVYPKDEADKIKYALSDNDQLGETDAQKAAELVIPHVHKINLERYHVQTVRPKTVKLLLEDFGPGGEGGGGEPQEAEPITCPECGHEFHLKDV